MLNLQILSVFKKLVNS